MSDDDPVIAAAVERGVQRLVSDAATGRLTDEQRARLRDALAVPDESVVVVFEGRGPWGGQVIVSVPAGDADVARRAAAGVFGGEPDEHGIVRP